MIFPGTVYASGSMKVDSVGAMIQEQVREKQLKEARQAAQPAWTTTTGGDATTSAEETTVEEPAMAAEATAENSNNSEYGFALMSYFNTLPLYWEILYFKLSNMTPLCLEYTWT